jgi:hypothetical protein
VIETRELPVIVGNACYDYFTEKLRLSDVYERLLDQIADEVFHITFLNRATLAQLNGFLARYVRDIDPMDLDPANSTQVTRTHAR